MTMADLDKMSCFCAPSPQPERVGREPRIDTCFPVAGPAKSDPKNLALVTSRDATIDIGKSRHDT
jgi:hypothetical protein